MELGNGSVVQDKEGLYQLCAEIGVSSGFAGEANTYSL